MLALSFLLLIGMSLIVEGFDQHIPKGYIYFAMGVLGVRRDDQPPAAEEGEAGPAARALRQGRGAEALMRPKRVQPCPAWPPHDPGCGSRCVRSRRARRRPRLRGRRRAELRAAARLRHRGAARSPTSKRWWRTLARADVVFVGEQHDDPNTHRLELRAVLEGWRAAASPSSSRSRCSSATCRRRSITTCRARSPEEEFLKEARPWPRYATDYRPLVETSRRRRRLAGRRRQRAAADRVGGREVGPAGDRCSSSPADRRCSPRELQCPRDEYFDRFAERDGRATPDAPAPPATHPTSSARRPSATTWRSASRTRRWRSRSPRRSRSDRAGTPAPSSTSTARSTATSAPAPPSAPAAACAGTPRRRHLDAARRGPRHARAGRRRSQARGLSRLHDSVASGFAAGGTRNSVLRRGARPPLDSRCGARRLAILARAAGACAAASIAAAPACPRPRTPSPRSRRTARRHARRDRSCRSCPPACGGSGSSSPSTSSDIAGMLAGLDARSDVGAAARPGRSVGADAAQQRRDRPGPSRRAASVPVKPNPVGSNTPPSDSSISTWLASWSLDAVAIGRARRAGRSPRS